MRETDAGSPTIFQDGQATLLDGSVAYLWSNAANWIGGTPQNGGQVVASQPLAPLCYDDIAHLSLGSLSLDGGQAAPGSVAVGGTLTVATLLAPDDADGTIGAVFSDALAGAPSAQLTIGSVVGTAEIAAIGHGAVTSVLGATDTGEFYDVAFGGELELSATPNAASRFTYDTPGSGVFAFRDPGPVVASKLQTVSAGDAIALPGGVVSSVVYGANSIAITTDVATTVFSDVDFFLNIEPTGYSVQADPSGLMRVTFGCFATGTRIATPGGDVAVEHLLVGDMVTTLDGARAVVWLGRREIDLRAVADPEPGTLVRVRAGAFSDGVPRRDLLITQEHSLLIDGRLVPVRMLVNGATIVLDRNITRYAYHHVELARHGILFAEGLPTESYLDTGNRATFANPAPLTATQTWDADAAAPLDTTRAFVEPVWHRLRGRAAELGSPVPAATALHADPAAHMLTTEGVAIWPAWIDGQQHVFLIPPGFDAAGLRLASRASRPSDVIGPFADDRRMLGVLVGRIVVADDRGIRPIEAHLSAPTTDGWHAVEDGRPARRWTDGRAVLPIGLDPQRDRAARVSVQIVGGGPYLADAASSRAALGRAR